MKSKPVLLVRGQVAGVESLFCAEFGDLGLGPVVPESKLGIMLQGTPGDGLFFLPRLHECM